MEAKPAPENAKSTRASPKASARAPEAEIARVLDGKLYVAEHEHVSAGQPTKRRHLTVSTPAEHAATLLRIAAPNEAKLVAALESRYLRALPLRVVLARACKSLRKHTLRAFHEPKDVTKCDVHRAEMMRICRRAFRRRAQLQQVLSQVREGQGARDLLEDSIALRTVTVQNAAMIRVVGGDPEVLIAEALEHERAIAPVSPDHATRIKGGSAEVLRRNQAIHYLLEALREVRDHAAFAVDKNKKVPAAHQGLSTAWQSPKKPIPDEADEDDSEDGSPQAGA